jgi:hypothetical protein
VRSVVLALALLAVAAPAAAASPGATLTARQAEVTLGQKDALNGVVADGFTVFPNQTVVLEGQRAPFKGAFVELARTVTDAQGAFGFTPKLDRNYRLRASVPALTIVSQVVRTFTLPRFRLTFRGVRPGVVRLIQTYTVPHDVRLTAPTLFYLGARKARRSSLRVRRGTARVRAGRYRAGATVKLPRAWHGRFRFASCFHPTAASGMGRTSERCPRRFSFGSRTSRIGR